MGAELPAGCWCCDDLAAHVVASENVGVLRDPEQNVRVAVHAFQNREAEILVLLIANRLSKPEGVSRAIVAQFGLVASN